MIGPAHDVSALFRFDPSAGRSYWINVWLCLVIAGALVAGGDERFVSPAFDTFRATGGPYAWAAVWGCCAGWLVAARSVGLGACRMALCGAATVHLLFAVGFTVAAARFPSATWLGAVLWVMLAVAAVSRSAAFHGRGR